MAFRGWRCPRCQTATFGSLVWLERHLRNEHGEKITVQYGMFPPLDY